MGELDYWPNSPLLGIVSGVREPQLPVLVAAHRGDSQNAPENTLAAFALAIEHKADLIEFDVHETADGDVVVIHDPKVDRTSDGAGEVSRLGTDELRELSVGSWFAPGFAGERVPLLDEVLDLCRGKVVPMIEIKVKCRRGPATGTKVVEALRRHGMAEQSIVICKELDRVKEVSAAAPETPLIYLTFTKRQARAVTRLPGVAGVNPYWKSLSLGLVQELHGRSFFITPWTVNRVKDYERLFLLGCEAIITDCPVTLRDHIEGFEFARAVDLQDRFQRGEADLDLERVEDAEGASPEEVSRVMASDSELDMDFDFPEDPPE